MASALNRFSTANVRSATPLTTIPGLVSPLTADPIAPPFPPSRSSASSAIVFIDAAVPDYQQLVNGVVPGTDVHVLDPARDAMAQITLTLAGCHDVSSVHIVSHGSPGTLQLGAIDLNDANLDAYANQLQQWRSALTDDADILLYGCDIAASDPVSPPGTRPYPQLSTAAPNPFLTHFAALTGADVAASNNPTGSAALGGDWTLEVNTGEIAASLVFQASTLAQYQHLLPLDLISATDATLISDSAGGFTSGALSTTGRYVVFNSSAANLVKDDTNGLQDVFVRDGQTGETTLVSQNLAGTNGGNKASTVTTGASISGDGRYVVFTSNATDLVAGDTNGFQDVFVRDRQTGKTSLVSHIKDGTNGGNGDSLNPIISRDGRYIAFESTASNLVATDKNTASDVFVYDVQTQKLTLVSQNLAGTDSGDNSSANATFSSDGRYIAFTSFASNLVAADRNNAQDVFVRDLQTGKTSLVSSNKDDTGSGNSASANALISANGRYVTFTSSASDLVANDANSAQDVFVRDLQTGKTSLVSSNKDDTGSGNRASSAAATPQISDDGRYVAFVSEASNLVGNDTNALPDVFVRDVQTGKTTLISLNQDGTSSGNNDSSKPVISGDGKLVAFVSNASNLIAGDTNAALDVFVRDWQAGKTALVSANAGNTGGGNQFSDTPAISNDGSSVVFTSAASNLINGDRDDAFDVFVRNLPTSTTTLVSSRDPELPFLTGDRSSGDSSSSVSADGRYIAFVSTATNLVPNDTNAVQDVFVRDVDTGTTTLVSRSSTGTIGNRNSFNPVISGDGRYVAFVSFADNLVEKDTNGNQDVFVRDLQTGTTTLVSRNQAGTDSGAGASTAVAWSQDGRYLLFTSTASNLVSGDTNDVQDVFVYDRQTSTVTLVSRNQAGTSSGNGAALDPAISSDGRYVAFTSDASNLIADDTNQSRDVFVRDLQTGTTTLVSRSSPTDGDTIAPSAAETPTISSDGRYIAFTSTADTLVANDTNGSRDVFLYDQQTGTTTLVSRTTSGSSGNGDSSNPEISGDGRYVVFVSNASDLASGDNNGSQDVFVYDRQTQTVTLVSRNQANSAGATAANPSLTDDGRYIAFTSEASSLSADGNPIRDVLVWDRRTGQTTQLSRTSTGTSGNGPSTTPIISRNGNYVAFSSDASNLVAGDYNQVTDVFGYSLNLPPSITLANQAVTYTIGADAILVASGATIADPDSLDFNTGRLTVNLSRNGSADDRLGIRNQGTAAGEIGFSDGSVTYGGVALGRVTGGTGTTPLVITFTDNASIQAVQALLQNLTFTNTASKPATDSRTVQFVLQDGDRGTSSPVTQTIALMTAPPPSKPSSQSEQPLSSF